MAVADQPASATVRPAERPSSAKRGARSPPRPAFGSVGVAARSRVPRSRAVGRVMERAPGWGEGRPRRRTGSSGAASSRWSRAVKRGPVMERRSSSDCQPISARGFGRGFSRQNRQQMRQFYLLYPPDKIRQTASGKSRTATIRRTASGESGLATMQGPGPGPQKPTQGVRRGRARRSSRGSSARESGDRIVL